MFSQPLSSVITLQWQQIALILLFYFIAWIVHRLARRIAGRFMRLNRLASQKYQLSQPRQETLRGLMTSAISFLIFTSATLLIEKLNKLRTIS